MIVRLTEGARQDIQEILTYSRDRFGAEQAARYRETLENGLQSLRRFPHVGVAVEHIRPDYRCFQVAYHRIFYRLDDDVIAVMAILHESQLPKLHLPERQEK